MKNDDKEMNRNDEIHVDGEFRCLEQLAGGAAA